MPTKKDFMLLLGKWRPYNVIGQCLDRSEGIKTDTLQHFPEYELENSQLRTEPAPAIESREYPNSSDRAKVIFTLRNLWSYQIHLYDYLWAERLSNKIRLR